MIGWNIKDNRDINEKHFSLHDDIFLVSFFVGLRILFFVLVANEPDSQLKEHSNRSHRLGAMVLSATWFKFNWAWKFSTCCLNSPPRAYHFYHSSPERHFLTSRTISLFNVPYIKLISNDERLSTFISAY